MDPMSGDQGRGAEQPADHQKHLPTIDTNGVLQWWHPGMADQTMDERLHNAVRIEQTESGRLFAVAKLPDTGFSGRKFWKIFSDHQDHFDKQHGVTTNPGEFRIKLPKDMALPAGVTAVPVNQHGGSANSQQIDPVIAAAQTAGPDDNRKPGGEGGQVPVAGPRFLGPPIQNQNPKVGGSWLDEPHDPPLAFGGGHGPGKIGPVESADTDHGHHNAATDTSQQDVPKPWFAGSGEAQNPLGGFSADGNTKNHDGFKS